MNQGILSIITGNGKGKTTSALGQALRTAGWGYRVLIVQFLKKGQSGEIKALRKIPRITVKQFGQKGLTNLKKPGPEDRKMAGKGLAFVRKAIESRRYRLIILDEINLVIKYRLINRETVIELIKSRPKDLNLVLTGRRADRELIEMADLVSQVKNIKHPFDNGQSAKEGIEY